MSPKCPSAKKKEALKLSEWVSAQIFKQYKSKGTEGNVKNVVDLLGQLQLDAWS